MDLGLLAADAPTGVMLCGHGSRDPEACREFGRVVGAIARRLPHLPVEHGYLEFARPVIRDGLERLRHHGVQRVLAAPGMLFAAGHVKNDVPSVLNGWARETGIELLMARDLGIDAKLLQASRDRIEAALAAVPPQSPLLETLLLVVGRGTSDSDANGNVAKVARMLWEGMGFGHAEIAYSGVTSPSTDLALARAVKLGFERVVVFPYFLFTGVLVRRIYGAVDAAAAAHRNVQFLKARYLDDHPLVVQTFLERIAGTLAGDSAMNCSLCKYRVQILGHEDALGAPQEGHHHHVEGIGTDVPDQHRNGHPAPAHDHHHHPHGHPHHHHRHGRGHHHEHT
jgi:sirohydrochlorin cobaltochelatase